MKPAKYTRICKECGKEFTTDHPKKIYCSDQCRVNRNIRKFKEKNKKPIYPIECPICGKVFTPTSKKTKYCPECKKDKNKLAKFYRDQRRMEWKLYSCCKRHGGIDKCPFPDCIVLEGKQETKTCEICGKEFELKGNNHKYCSDCSKDVRRKQVRESLSRSRTRQKEEVGL